VIENILESFKNSGYITGHTGDTGPSPWTLVLEDYFFEYLDDKPADHEGLSFMVDPHYLKHEAPTSSI